MGSKLQMPKVNLDQELSLREKVFLVAVLVGVLLLFLNVLWEPLSTRMDAERATFVALEGQVSSLEQLIDATRGLFAAQEGGKKEEAKVDERVKRFLEKKVLDPTEATHDAVTYLGSRELSRGLTIRDIKVDPASEKTSYTMVPISLHAVGRYGAILSYFSSLEKLDRPIVVRRFTVSKAAEQGGSIDARLEAELYLPK